ncbi:unnamed protein product [Closterium sp. NIES-54]
MMNVFFDANYVSEDTAKIRYAVSLLQGPAMDWWRVIVTKPTEYATLPTREGQTGPWAPSYFIEDYTNGFLALCDQVGYMHESERIDRYIGGLKHEIAQEIQLRGVTDFQEILAMAEKLDFFRRPRLGAKVSGSNPSVCISGITVRGGCQRSTGDPRLILGKGYRHVGLGGYGRTDPLLNKPFYPNDPHRPFELVTDASDIAVGAVLLQDFGNGLHPVAYESRKLHPPERNYPIHDREMLAIVHAFKVWRCYLIGADVTVTMDFVTGLPSNPGGNETTDSQTERTNQTMEQLIRATCDDLTSWEQQLPLIEFAYNNVTLATAQQSPFYPNYGQNPTVPMTPSPDNLTPRAQQFDEILQAARTRAAEAIKKTNVIAKRNADRPVTYQSGDYVLLGTLNVRLPIVAKLQPRFCGPFQISHMITPVTAHLLLPTDSYISPSFHVSPLRPYIPTTSQLPRHRPPSMTRPPSEPIIEPEKILSNRIGHPTCIKRIERCLHSLCVRLVPVGVLAAALSGPSVPPLRSSLSPYLLLHPPVLSPPPLYPPPTLPTPLLDPLLPLSLPEPHLPNPLPPLYPRPLSAALAPAPPPSPHPEARRPEPATRAGSPAAASAVPPLRPSWSAPPAVPSAHLPPAPPDPAADVVPTVPRRPAVPPQPSAPTVPQPVSPLPPPIVPAVSLELPPCV